MTKVAINSLVVAKSLEKKSLPIRKKVSDLEVVDQESFDLAASLIKQLKAYVKESKAEEDKIADPIKEALANLRAHFKPFNDSIAALEFDTKLKMSVWVEGQQKKQLKVAEDLESGKIKKVSTFISKSEALQVKSPSASVRKVKVLRITNEKLIPREYLVPDEAKIKADLLKGISIAGCKIDLENSIAI